MNGRDDGYIFMTYKEYNDKYAFALDIHVVDREDGYFLVPPELLKTWEEKRVNYEKGNQRTHIKT